MIEAKFKVGDILAKISYGNLQRKIDDRELGYPLLVYKIVDVAESETATFYRYKLWSFEKDFPGRWYDPVKSVVCVFKEDPSFHEELKVQPRLALLVRYGIV